MNFTELFIRRPVATTLVMIGIIGAGVVGYRGLAVSDLPTVDYPTINVRATLPGASPETMAAAVAAPLENQFSSIPGVTTITSTSGQGGTSITLQFALDRDIDGAAQDVQAAIASVQRILPKDMPAPPSYSKANPADQPIITIALTSPTLPLSTVDDYAETLLAKRLSAIEGVGQVNVVGGKKFAVRIQVDPRTLAYRRIALEDVVNAIQESNVNSPTGVLWGQHQALSLEANGQLNNAAAFKSIAVAYRNGAPVRLEDLGTVLDDVQDTRSISYYNGTAAVTINVQRQPGSNTVQVADAVRAAVTQLQGELPPSIRMDILSDRSSSIRDTVADVKFTLLLALGLVVMVIFLFLRKIYATVIPSVALPLSIVGTFGVMALMGYSIDNLSMMALTLAVGFVVDDAIVMLENIVRHVEMGKKPMQAALDGAREVGFTIVSMTLSLAAVFIPVLFMGGLLGRLFREFAVTIGVAILVSGFVSLTLTPMMCSRFLKAHSSKPERRSRFYEATERIYQRSVDWYEVSLHWVMRHRLGTMVFSGVVLVATIVLFVYTPKGFIPDQDIGQINGSLEMVQGASYDEVLNHLLISQKILMQHNDPDIVAVSTSTGGGGVGHGANHYHANFYLKPPQDRKRTADQIMRELRTILSVTPGIQVFLNVPPAISIGGRGTNSRYQLTLQTSNLDELYRYAAILLDKMSSLPGIIDPTSDLMIKSPYVKVEIDRQRADALGISAGQIEQVLYDAFGTRQVSTIYSQSNQYQVMLELLPEFQRDANALSMVYIRSSAGTLIPLGSVARLTPKVGPFTVNHSGQLPSVTLSFNLKPGVALGTAVDQVQALARATLPSTITTSFSGTAQAFQESQKGLTFMLLVAVMVIYLVLGVLYESFIHPITILSGLPFAAFGALITLVAFGTDLNIYAYVGIIMLVGLVKKNAIMMVDFALQTQRNENKAPAEAIVQACLVRFRPIMMTTMSALVGTLPIAIGLGVGGEARQPLGLAVVGGLAFSQTVTLYVTPVIYTYFDAFQKWMGSRSAEAQHVLGPAGEATLGAAD